jgi:hypothetical protein
MRPPTVVDIANLSELLTSKKQHLARLSAMNGASGEVAALKGMPSGIARPKGVAWKALYEALVRSGISIRSSSFDFIILPSDTTIDFKSPESLDAMLPHMIFVEVRTSNQSRVKASFGGFIFALTESEIAAAEQLGDRHRFIARLVRSMISLWI